MKKTVLISIAVAACLALTVSTVRGDEEQSRRTYQTANLFQAGNPGNQLGGAATLFRSRQRLEMRVAASGLNQNSAYTVWWVIFNNPAACSAPGCGPDDLAVPAVRASVFYAAGFVTGMDGTGYASGSADAGALPDGVDNPPEGTVSGLRRGGGLRAEVHIVVRTHGPINPGFVNEQIGTFNGGCNPTCVNQQAAIFAPVQ